MAEVRQNLLILCLASSSLESQVKAWTLYDGTGREKAITGDSESPPYETGLEALQDGWRVIQIPQLIPPAPGTEYSTSFMRFEYVFEKLEELK